MEPCNVTRSGSQKWTPTLFHHRIYNTRNFGAKFYTATLMHVFFHVPWICRFCSRFYHPGWTFVPNFMKIGLNQTRLDYCNAVIYGAVVGSGSEVAARAEHCSTDCSANSKTVVCSAAVGTTTLVARSPAHRIQTCHPDVQDPQHIDTVIPQPSHHTTRICSSPPFLHHTLPRSTSRPPERALLTALSDVLHPLSGTLW